MFLVTGHPSTGLHLWSERTVKVVKIVAWDTYACRWYENAASNRIYNLYIYTYMQCLNQPLTPFPSKRVTQVPHHTAQKGHPVMRWIEDLSKGSMQKISKNAKKRMDEHEGLMDWHSFSGGFQPVTFHRQLVIHESVSLGQLKETQRSNPFHLSLPETNMFTSDKWGLGHYFPFGKTYFQRWKC